MAEAYEHAPCGAPVYAVRHAPVLAYGQACHMFTIQQFLGVLGAVKAASQHTIQLSAAVHNTT
jgi:hypothetical protein